jgi:UDP:flavonoid glycosyltransferase YjiC (YdhE family)
MRVLFATWAWGSHYFPTVPLGWALRSAGHEVLVASAPGFASTITRSGLPAATVGPDIDIAALLEARKGAELRQERETGVLRQSVSADLDTNAKRRAQARDGAAVFADIAALMADDLVALGRAWRPDAVVYEPTTFAGALVARALDVPAIRHLWTVDFTRRIDEFSDDLLGPLAEKFGVKRLDVLGDVTVDPCTPDLQLPDGPPSWPIRYVPYNGPAVLPGWLREPPVRPRVCVTWGTSISGMGLGHLYRVPEVLDAFADRDVELVVTASADQRTALRDVPRNVRLVDPVALHLLLPTCAAVVHQGGGGTMMTALGLGVPQLTLPHIPDQTLNSRQLAHIGAGRFVLGHDITRERLQAAFAEVFDQPSVRAAAQAAAAQMAAQPTPHDVAARLERFVG